MRHSPFALRHDLLVRKCLAVAEVLDGVVAAPFDGQKLPQECSLPSTSGVASSVFFHLAPGFINDPLRSNGEKKQYGGERPLAWVY